MTVTSVRKDPHRLTMTVEAEFKASPERVWQLWADPRQLGQILDRAALGPECPVRLRADQRLAKAGVVYRGSSAPPRPGATCRRLALERNRQLQPRSSADEGATLSDVERCEPPRVRWRR